MGLSIAHGLALAMGGRLEIDSICGQGTVAQAILPLPLSQRHASTDALIDLKDIAVLVADDNAANRKILYMMLDKLGGKVTLCEDGDLAIKAWQNGTFDLLLLDINMPRLAGTDVIREIRHLEAANDRNRIPAIAVTANAGADQVPQYLEAGFDDCLGKPFTLSKLSAALAS